MGLRSFVGLGPEPIEVSSMDLIFGNRKLEGALTGDPATGEWEAEITHQVPDERIAWKSVDGSSHSGTVTFQTLSPERTRVTAAIEYEPEGFVEKTGDALGFPSAPVQADLERFRDFIEERGRETGGWRGEIRGEQVPYPSSISPMGTREGFRKEIEDQPYRTEAEVSTEKTGQGQRTGEVAAKVPLSEEEVLSGYVECVLRLPLSA